MVEMLQLEICQSRCFSKGMGHFQRKFLTKVGIAHQPQLVSES